ncbi:hypothetical protein ASD24_24575 [Paenibacillus sp. Root52]|uniref:hypothetical protein n=1 Tax=Paenibacillus sp. Root52 TaxID=1736552 RepID=UPI0006F3B7E2|nr:hypothetical protein [Paenibacillus sp. Root52]KQY90975.1 hypothetical protein ASD24_24575 [Paenibacillus sp. Root52]
MSYKFKKSETKRFVKTGLQGKPVDLLIYRINFVISFSLSFLAKRLFENNPHEWYELGDASIFIAAAFLLSLMNIYISYKLNFVEALRGKVFQGKYAKLKVAKLLGSYIAPFVFPIYSLVTHPELIMGPFLTILAIVLMQHNRPLISSKA